MEDSAQKADLPSALATREDVSNRILQLMERANKMFSTVLDNFEKAPEFSKVALEEMRFAQGQLTTLFGHLIDEERTERMERIARNTALATWAAAVAAAGSVLTAVIQLLK